LQNQCDLVGVPGNFRFLCFFRVELFNRPANIVSEKKALR
jgi:hypothetical protein